MSTIEAVRQIMKTAEINPQNKPRKSVQYQLSKEDNDIMYPSEVYKGNAPASITSTGDTKSSIGEEEEEANNFFRDVKNFDFVTQF